MAFGIISTKVTGAMRLQIGTHLDVAASVCSVQDGADVKQVHGYDVTPIAMPVGATFRAARTCVGHQDS